MDFFPAAPGVEALADGVDLAVEAAGEVLVKAGETVAGAAVVGIVDNPVHIHKDSDGEVKVLAGAVVELLSAEAAPVVGPNAPGDPLALLDGILALLAVEAHLATLENALGDLLAVNQAAGVLLEVLAGEDLLLTVVVGVMDNKAGAVAELDGVLLLVVVGVLKVPLVPKASTLRCLAKLFKLVTQFLSGTMLMVVLPVSTLELKLKRMEPSLLLPTLKCPELTTLVPFHETLQSLLSSFAVS